MTVFQTDQPMPNQLVLAVAHQQAAVDRARREASKGSSADNNAAAAYGQCVYRDLAG